MLENPCSRLAKRARCLDAGLRIVLWLLACGPDVVSEKAVTAVLDNFWQGTAPERDDRRSGRHRFDLNEAEGFRPVDREQQGRGIAEERPLVGLSDLADELNQRILQQWQDLTLEIRAIGRVDLGCD